MFDVDVIIAGYNTNDLICQCIDSIFEKKEKTQFKCYYVDDGSRDGSADCVEKRYRQVEVIRNRTNLGLGYSYNRGIEKGKSEYIVLINSDVIVNEAWLDGPINQIRKHPEVGAVGGKIFLPDGRLQKECMCRSFPNLWSELVSLVLLDKLFKHNRIFGSYKMLFLNYDREIEIDQPSGTYLTVRRKAIEDVGLFDEKYKFYYVDVDLSYRLKQKGWRQMFMPHGSVIHYGTPQGGKTISRMGYERITMRILNKLYFFRKNYGRLKYYLLRPVVFAEVLMKLLASLVCYAIKRNEEKKIALKNIKAFSKAVWICLRPLPASYKT